MQEEREDDVARDEEVEGHRRFGPEDPPARQDNDSDEDEVEAHRWRYGAEEPGKRF